MSSAAYLALIERGSKDLDKLIDIELAQVLYGSTAVGGNTYSFPLSTLTHPASVRADRGFVREITGVQENGTALTSRASIAAVQANPGSYYFDAAAELVYVQTSGSVNPDNTIAALYAIFVLRVSGKPHNYATGYPYYARVDGLRVPTIRGSQSDPTRGVSVYESGDLSLANGDGIFDYLMSTSWANGARYVWDNAKITFRMTGDALLFSEAELVGQMQVARPALAGDTTCILQLKSRQNVLDTLVLRHTYSDFFTDPVTSPGGFVLNKSLYMPLFFGDVDRMPLTFVAFGGGTSSWISYDFFLIGQSTIREVIVVEKATGAVTTLTVGVDYFNNMFSAIRGVLISNTYDPASYDAYISLTNGTASVAGLTKPGETALFILTSIVGVPSSEISTADFSTFDAQYPAPRRMSLYIPGGDITQANTTARDALDLIERSYLCRIRKEADGLYHMRAFNPAFDLSTVRQLRDSKELLESWAPVDDADQHPVAAVKVAYNGHGLPSGEWTYDVRSSSTTEASVRLGRTETDPILTCLADSAAADELGARCQWIASTYRRQWQGTSGMELMGANVGDKVRVNRTRGVGDQVLQVEAFTKQLSSGNVGLTLSNIWGLDEQVKAIAADGTAVYGSATTDEKRNYAYVASDDGRVDTTDQATYRQAQVF